MVPAPQTFVIVGAGLGPLLIGPTDPHLVLARHRLPLSLVVAVANGLLVPRWASLIS